MKRFVSLMLIASFLLSMLAGCQQNEPDDRTCVVATIFAPFDFVREIAGDAVNASMLLPPASESHSFEPTPKDIIKIQNCDIFIYVGGESDAWVNQILSSMDTSNMKIITLMDCVDLVEEEIVEGMEDDDDDSDDIAYDEHVWTSPKNAKLIVQKISDALCKADAQNATLFQARTTAYLERLDDLDAAFKSVVDGAVRKTIVFGDRFPFRYFTDAYGLDYFAAFPGCASETEPNPKTVAFLIDKIREENIPVVFHIELSNPKMANTIRAETGAKVLLLHSCHNISRDDFRKGLSYMELMTRNVEALREALQ